MAMDSWHGAQPAGKAWQSSESRADRRAGRGEICVKAKTLSRMCFGNPQP